MPGKSDAADGQAFAMTFFKKIREGIVADDANVAAAPVAVDLSKSINAINNRIGIVAIRTDSEASSNFNLEIWARFPSAPEFSQNMSSLDEEWVHIKDLGAIEPRQYYLVENIPAGEIKIKVSAYSAGTWDIHASFPDNR